jgi:anti-sigma regulatory factor (Ser/Thr protein kinase)
MHELQVQHNSKDFTKHHSIRGRGLFLIISRLVDSLEFEDVEEKGLKVIVTKSLQEHSDS